MNFRELTADELAAFYRRELTAAFPPAELKPLAAMEALRRRGRYLPLGLFAQTGEPVSALLLWTGERCALMDYLATARDWRGGGLGAELISRARAALPQFHGLLGEVEAEAGARGEELALRRRRLAFYLRCGFRLLDYDCALFGVHYRCILLGELPDAAALAEHRAIYQEHFSPKHLARFIQLPLAPGEAVKPAARWTERGGADPVEG